MSFVSGHILKIDKASVGAAKGKQTKGKERKSIYRVTQNWHNFLYALTLPN